MTEKREMEIIKKINTGEETSKNNIHRVKSGVKTIITPECALIGENIALLDKEIRKCLEAGEVRLVIDFESVTFIDCEGLEKLLEFYNQVRRSGGSLDIFNPNPLCNEILNITRITDYLDIYFSLDQAGGSK